MHQSSEQSGQAGHAGQAEQPSGPGTAAGTSGLLAGLDTVADLPLHEHAAVYEQVHARLQAALSEIDSA